MMRVTASVDQAELDGSPELWRIALDLLSAEESIETVGAALKWLIGMEFPAGHLRENAGCFSVAALTSSAPKETEDIFRRFDLRARRLLCHRSIRYVLAAEALVNGMIGDGSAAMFTKMLPIDLLRYAAAVGRTQPGFADALIPVTRYGAFQAQINAANILHAMKIGWKPDGRHTAQLTDAHLEEALWPEVKLARCWGDRTHFERADLKRADFERSSLRHAYFNSACLRGAILREADASQADFTDADLSLCLGPAGKFRQGNPTTREAAQCRLCRLCFHQRRSSRCAPFRRRIHGRDLPFCETRRSRFLRRDSQLHASGETRSSARRARERIVSQGRSERQ